MIFRIGGLHYWYVPVINNKNERIIGIYPGLISTGMDNRTSKDCSLSKILDREPGLLAVASSLLSGLKKAQTKCISDLKTKKSV